jgi:hypothetical protein
MSPVSDDAIQAETIAITGHGGDRRQPYAPRAECPALGPSARVALELTEETAIALVDAIRRAIASAPTGLASKAQ